MLPIVTPEEMGAIDAAAPDPVEVLIERAGAAVTRAALDLLGGTYGRQVAVLAGKGNNGNDGRAAARRLATRGVRVAVWSATDAPSRIDGVDLVIDAAYGTGFHGTFDAPDVAGAAVLAVDIPSGVDGLTGVASGAPLAADVTVTFAALKPGLLFGDGARLAGEVDVADIGLDGSGSAAHLVTDDDVAGWLPARDRAAHKWTAAVLVVAGSPGMGGAAHLAAAGAQRAGAGMVRVLTPGAAAPMSLPLEAVAVDGSTDWVAEALGADDRAGAVLIGPGLPTDADTLDGVARLVGALDVPLVLDGGALDAVVARPDAVRSRTAPTVLTPHDGEFGRLARRPPADDRIAAARSLASELGATVVLKGPTTVVAGAEGDVLVAAAGDERLATAGTGDVLAGAVAAALARGAGALSGAAASAHLHGRAAELGDTGLVAGDLVDLLGAARDELER